MKRLFIPVLLATAAAIAGTPAAQARDIVITHVGTLTGPAGAYGTQAFTGFKMGLEHLTNGTMQVNGNKIVLIQKDDQGKPDLAKALVTGAYADDKSDIVVGPTLSASVLASLTAAEEAKKIMLVDAAITDSVTGDKWNRYIFRTARIGYQDSVCAALAWPENQDLYLGTMMMDITAFHDSLTSMKEVLAKYRPRIKIAREEFLPPNTTDFTAPTQRLIDALKDKPGQKMIAVGWIGAHPMAKIMALQPERFGIGVAPGGNLLQVMQPWRNYAGTTGCIYYYYGFPKNKLNDWLVAEHQKRFGVPPDFFTAGGMVAASAVVEALKKTGGDPDTEKLIKAMEGLTFESVKGPITLRKEDHQAMQDMYVFRIKDRKDQKGDWDFLELVRTIHPAEAPVPILNKR
jgi:branched-chain amino acid transport system substrate-binding protein